MYRGTTPTIKIKLKGVELSRLKKIFVTIRQEEKELTKSAELIEIEHDNEDEPSFRWDGGLFIDEETDIIYMPLSQEDTLTFSRGHVDIQLRAVTKNESAIASNIQMLFMNKILKEGVIS